ncbi:hypothetical protein H009_19462 [Agrobacterium tumefaciens str. Cherry 2E-2-2]|nr:hypothetical protein H009_19462 [Agrobacterium tumefaciens str. Cherry 2E-2-2]
MPLHSPLHFDVVAVIGSKKIRTHKKENDVIGVDVVINAGVDVLACTDTPIMPCFNDTLAFQHGKLLFELVSQCFICV